MNNKYKTVVCGPFFENSGYSYLNRRFTKELINNGLDVGVETVRCNLEISKEDANFFYNLRRKDGNSKIYYEKDGDYNQNIIKIVCWIPLHNIPKFKHNVMYTMTETKDVSPNFIDPINKYYDECWLPTQYYADKFVEHGLKVPAHVIPIGIDEKYNKKNIKDDVNFNFKCFKKGVEPCYEDPQGFKFISIFRWTYRKGFDVLLKSFLREFKKSDDVSLIIVSRHVASTFEKRFYDAVENEIRRFVEEYGTEESAPIYWCSDNINGEDMPSIYGKGDVFVLPSRGDGVCLPALEASQMGLPIIVPNHTGFTDYATEDNSYLLDVDEWVLTNNDPGWNGWLTRLYINCYYPLFGEKVVEQLSHKMRYSMDNMDKSKAKNENMKRFISEKYDWDKCIKKAESRLIDIYG